MEKTPIHVTWHVTYECNLSCIHCYANAGRGATLEQLSTDEALRLIQEIAELGVKAIVFTGGEPLMRSDILDLIEYTSDIGLKPILATNGTLLNGDIIKRLKDVDASIAINLPSISEEIHRRFTGASSSLAIKLNVLDKCLRYGVKCSVGIAITKLNIKDVNNVIDYCLKREVFVDIISVVPCGRAKLDIIPMGAEYRDFLQHLWMKYRAIPMNTTSADSKVCIYEPIYLALLSENGKSNLNRLCSIGETINIMADGSIRPCVFIPYTLGNIRRKSLAKIWRRLIEDRLVQELRDLNKLKGICRSCNWNIVCGGCRARAYFIKGDLFASDPICWLNT